MVTLTVTGPGDETARRLSWWDWCPDDRHGVALTVTDEGDAGAVLDVADEVARLLALAARVCLTVGCDGGV